MSRSVHTEPARILAARRLRAPYARRGSSDPSTARSLFGALRGAGIVPPPPLVVPSSAAPAPLPRLCAQRPRPGHLHPAGLADVARVLRCCDEYCVYGLRSVELVSGRAGRSATTMQFGRLLVPGRLVLYDQPTPPWAVPGALPAELQTRLRRAGALVTPAGGGSQTVVSWPDETLRDFMLFDVLMHEIGHHLIQHNKGKRRARVARTRDHEAFANHFAAECRLRYGAQTGE